MVESAIARRSCGSTLDLLVQFVDLLDAEHEPELAER
jgi:hypothetical protein